MMPDGLVFTGDLAAGHAAYVGTTAAPAGGDVEAFVVEMGESSTIHSSPSEPLSARSEQSLREQTARRRSWATESSLRCCAVSGDCRPRASARPSWSTSRAIPPRSRGHRPPC